ncbi:laccase domain-containing protein [Candidatus Dojkabacteria bacterium]|uniref:Laccase domain-containing protein n=1 Tax=Candidatus Dojkabacteria bacterium TaxID=2099670 RepID=A0A955IES9_9BACT|nr:laccase domain-containing protein [Candidatus Dojkabacteria bacterium]
MHTGFKEKNNLGFFTELEELGVKNFFTYDNSIWGHMGISSEDANEKYKKLFDLLEINLSEVIYIGSSHNNEVQFLDENNLPIYQAFNRHDKSGFVVINTDGLITKLTNIPLIITPADCAIICITGVDKKDGKRFITNLHAGIYGTMLKIHTIALKLIRDNYEASDMKVFIFPSVSSNYYKKSLDDKLRGRLAKDPHWADFTNIEKDMFSMDIERKLVSDFKNEGIDEGSIFVTGVNTYDEQEKGRLFSATYAKAHDLPKRNFAVGLTLK